MNPSQQRFVLSLYWLTISAVLIVLDGMDIIDVTKWGYGGLFTLITLIIQFYVRKATSGEK